MRLSLRRYQSIPMNSAEEAQVVPIVGDAAIATVGVGHGRLIPLIIDTTSRPDLAEVIKAQVHLPEGDVVVQCAMGLAAQAPRSHRPPSQVSTPD